MYVFFHLHRFKDLQRSLDPQNVIVTLFLPFNEKEEKSFSAMKWLKTELCLNLSGGM